MLLKITCGVMGLLYAVLTWLVAESERGAIPGDTSTKVMSAMIGIVAGLVLYQAILEGWGLVALFMGFVFLLMQMVAAAL